MAKFDLISSFSFCCDLWKTRWIDQGVRTSKLSWGQLGWMPDQGK